MRVKEIYNDFNNGLFNSNSFKTLFTFMPEFCNIYTDIEYLLNRSGEKIASPLLENLSNKTIDEINNILSNVLFNKYGEDWKKQLNALKVEYKPLENYNRIFIKEQDEDQKTTTTDNSETTSENEKMAFDSEVYSKDTKTTTKGNGGAVVSDTKIKVNTYKETTTGNIGVTTNQQMLESELKLRDKYKFLNIVFKDVDEVLTIGYY